MKRFAPKTLSIAAVAALLAVVLAATAPATAVAEDNQPTSAGATAAAPASPPAAADKRGVLNELGSWWDSSITFFSTKLKDARGKFEDVGKTSKDVAKDVATDAAAATQEAVKSAVEAGKDAAGALVRLPNTRLIEMRERCDKASNGAPDCTMAAAGGCRAKGFTTGKLIEVSSAITCPTPRELAQQRPKQIECPIETFVTRAVCQ